MFSDATLVATKDLRIELRSRVALTQLLPFAIIVLVLFAFALDPDRNVLTQAASGLYWVAVLFISVLAVQRSFRVETDDGARDNLLLSSLDPAGIFLGKTLAIVAELIALEALLGFGVVVLYNVNLHSPLVLLGAALLGATALAGAGVVYGALAAGAKHNETLLPLLMLPVVSPVLIAATQSFDLALNGSPGESLRWLGVLGVFTVGYLVAGVLSFGALLEDA